MPEALQVDAQNLRGEGRRQSPWPSRGDDREAHRQDSHTGLGLLDLLRIHHMSETPTGELTAPFSLTRTGGLWCGCQRGELSWSLRKLTLPQLAMFTFQEF